MAWEIGPSPSVVEGSRSTGTFSIIGTVPAWGVGPAPDLVVGQRPIEVLTSVESVPVVLVTGTGSIEVTATSTIITVSAPVLTVTGTGSISVDGTGTVGEIEAAEEIIVVVTGDGTIQFQVTALGGAVIVYEATGSGSIGVSGTGTVTAVVPAIPVVNLIGSGSISVSGTGLVSGVVPAAVVVSISGTGSILFSGTGTLATLLADPSNENAPPSIASFSPAPGTPLTHLQPISFDVTDNTGFRRIVVAVRFPDSITELAHNGATFENGYSGTVDAIPGGLHYSVRRNSGWKGAPTFVIYAIDQHGNEATNGS